MLLPYIQTTRKNYFGWIPGTPVPEDLSCVSWIDGGMSQLQAIVDGKQQEIEGKLRVYSCKQSASRTAVEQACDVSPFFRSLSKIQTSVTMNDMPAMYSSPVQQSLRKGLFQMNLGSVKFKSLMDFIGCLPSMVSKAAPTPTTVINGFINNGMLYCNTKCYPDLDKILNTIRRDLTNVEEDLCEKYFKELFQYQLENGHVSDDIYDTLGFPMDIDIEGCEMDRRAKITQESHQRAKCLSHVVQRQQRQSHIDDFIEKKEGKSGGHPKPVGSLEPQ